LHITELEIDNFKSFSRKTKIPFLEGFTVISGPNGSGKSNIIDSILFVLALSSSRNLRAEKLTDLINLNSGKNIAEVAISFSDGTKIRRRIKKTGNGYYSYNYLNDRLCKQSDIVDHLAKFGIIPHGYNVVMQGDVTRIMEMSDFERRKIIDEIAGVSEFDTKKAQALSELDVVRERIEREELSLIELTKRANELKKEREHALEYQKWQKELAFLPGDAAPPPSSTIRKRNVQRSLLRQKTRRSSSARIASDRSIEENELAYLKADLADVDELINQKSGPEYLKLIADLEEAKSGIKLAEQTIARLKKDKETNLEGINRVFADTKRAEARVQELSDQIRTLSIDRTNIAMEGGERTRPSSKRSRPRLSSTPRTPRMPGRKLFSLMEEAEAKKGERIRHPPPAGYAHREEQDADERARASHLAPETARRGICGKTGAARGEPEGLSPILQSRKKGSTGTSRNSKAPSLPSVHRSNGSAARYGMPNRTRYASKAAQQARGESGGKAIDAVRAMEGVHGTIMELGRAPPEYTTALNTAAGTSSSS